MFELILKKGYYMHITRIPAFKGLITTNNTNNTRPIFCQNITPLNNDSVSFSSLQNDKLHKTKIGTQYLDNTKSGWVIIPSFRHDSQNFEENTKKLESHFKNHWDVKPHVAGLFLDQGDFHIYFENGEPKIGIHFWDNEIEDVVDQKSNLKIPIFYLDTLKKHINDNNLKISEHFKYSLSKAEDRKAKFDKAQKDLKTAIKGNNAKAIFEYFGIHTQKDNNGYLTIYEYKQPSTDFSYSDLNIDEDKLLANVKTIFDKADFENSKISNIENLEHIGGSAYFKNSNITNLKNLKYIGGSADFRGSNVTDLGKLEHIGCDVFIHNSKLTPDDFINITKQSVNNFYD